MSKVAFMNESETKRGNTHKLLCLFPSFSHYCEGVKYFSTAASLASSVDTNKRTNQCI